MEYYDTFFLDTDLVGTVSITDYHEIRHLTKSLRKIKGDKIEVINGKGKRCLAKILSIERKSVRCQICNIIEEDREYSSKPLIVAIAVLNNDKKHKLLVEKLVEIGVYEIVFFVSEYTSFPDKLKDSSKFIPIAMGSLKQCRGSIIPRIIGPLSTKDLLLYIEKYPTFFCDFTTNNLDLKSVVKDGIPNLVLVGPEGGFSDSEKKLFLDKGAFPLSLNKRILKSETAAIVAASKFLF